MGAHQALHQAGIAWTAASRAHGEPPGRLSAGPRGERGSLLVVHLHPVDAAAGRTPAAPARAGQGVETLTSRRRANGSDAAFIGGAAVQDGVGKVPGAITGGLIMGVNNYGMSLIGPPSEQVMLVKGAVLLAPLSPSTSGPSAGRVAAVFCPGGTAASPFPPGGAAFSRNRVMPCPPGGGRGTVSGVRAAAGREHDLGRDR